ncbi:hypothetical protein EXIGLDRAFT_693157 [Exidia glandulosa HHB12029]|uniref:Uncharacterized protein n=1 Tax=Exidia glandulosa HHB12029 TaxID=1314781 RepID=A0A165HII1_EXIGL|nr:hypothetical protein EXIGLDRAFT_693157 [Exidia glandulosa HHB12029]
MFAIARSPLASPALQRTLAASASASAAYPFPAVAAASTVLSNVGRATLAPPTTNNTLAPPATTPAEGVSGTTPTSPSGFTLRLPTVRTGGASPGATTSFASAAMEMLEMSAPTIELRLPAVLKKRKIRFSLAEPPVRGADADAEQMAEGMARMTIKLTKATKSEFKSCRGRPPTPFPREEPDWLESDNELEVEVEKHLGIGVCTEFTTVGTFATARTYITSPATASSRYFSFLTTSQSRQKEDAVPVPQDYSVLHTQSPSRHAFNVNATTVSMVHSAGSLVSFMFPTPDPPTFMLLAVNLRPPLPRNCAVRRYCQCIVQRSGVVFVA